MQGLQEALAGAAVDSVAQALLFEDPGTRERLEAFVARRRR